jgi:DNA-binding NarL/FixJ family response regulator
LDPCAVDAAQVAVAETALRSRRTTPPPSKTEVAASSLTPRELDVLREMAQGKTNAGIKQALFLSESTVEKHINAIFTKLGLSAALVDRRVVAVLAFLENAPPSDRLDSARMLS